MGLDQVPAVQRMLSAAGVRDRVGRAPGRLGVDGARRRGPAGGRCCSRCAPTGLALKTKLLPPPGAAPGPGRKEAGNFNVQFRRELGLFASVRPLKNLPGLPARFQGVDMLVIRELTEDLYAAIEHEIVPGVVQSIKVVTEAACRRFFRFAFEWARAGRPQDGHLRPQGQHPQAGRRPVPGSVPRRGQGFPGAANARDHRRQLLHADGVAAAAVRRDGDGQSVRRPGQRPGGRRGRRHQRHGTASTSATACASTSRSTAAAASRSATNRANPLPLLLPAIDLLEGVGEAATAQRHLGGGRPGADRTAGGHAGPRRHGHDDADGGGGRRGAG